MRLAEVAAILEGGCRISFRPRGNSMTPRIKDGELVVLDPDTSEVKKARQRANEEEVPSVDIGKGIMDHILAPMKKH
tara:strand:+ start:2122 stop:2352 length:231 start_codon:yes stop_codon:yes gene_type:complete